MLFSALLFCHTRIPLVSEKGEDSYNHRHLFNKKVLLFQHEFVSLCLCLCLICVCCSSSILVGTWSLFPRAGKYLSCEGLEQGFFLTRHPSRAGSVHLCPQYTPTVFPKKIKFAATAPTLFLQPLLPALMCACAQPAYRSIPTTTEVITW